MIRVWLIAGISLLAGCESKFEQCMETELPKAYEKAGFGFVDSIPTEGLLRRIGSIRAERLSQLHTGLSTYEEEMQAREDWDLANPPPELNIPGLPEKPVYDCVLGKSEDYVQCAKDFTEASKLFNKQVQDIWAAVYDSDEYRRYQDELIQHENRRNRENTESVPDQIFDEITMLAREAGVTPECKDCSGALLARDLLTGLSVGNERRTEKLVARFKEASEAVQRIASDACNRNGIYK